MFKYIMLLLLLFPLTCYGGEFKPAYDTCLVTRVVDGDTFKASCEFRGNVTVRVRGIDTYESRKNMHALKQVTIFRNLDSVLANGKLAKQCLVKEIEGAHVLLELNDRRYGVYGRLLARVIVFRNNTFVNIVDIMYDTCKQGVYKINKEE